MIIANNILEDVVALEMQIQELLTLQKQMQEEHKQLLSICDAGAKEALNHKRYDLIKITMR